MKVLQNIKSELLVSIDIETVRVEDKFEDLSEGYQSAWEYKNKQDGKIPDNDELAKLWERTSSLYAEFSKICAVSLTYLNPQGSLVCKEFYGENEKAILEALAITLNNMINFDPAYRLVGHASKYFDYPFTGKRFIINGLDIPRVIDSTASKPWEQTNLCTNELWKLGGTGAGSSLQALCNVLDIPISKVDLVGDEVGTAFYNKEYERIGRYCSLDTIACFNVIRKFKKEPIFQFDDVTYIVAYSDQEQFTEEEVKKRAIIKLYESTNFPQDIKEEFIKSLVNLTEEDKENAKKIILAHYQKKGEKVGVKKAKDKEVNDFIDSLN